jgi:hypothetical protein
VRRAHGGPADAPAPHLPVGNGVAYQPPPASSANL